MGGVTMKVIVAGGREFGGIAIVTQVLDNLFSNTEVDITIISGGATGADAMGEMYARSKGTKPEVYKAKWTELGNGAGHIRNAEMAKVGDVLVAFWDGASPGTANMIKQARKDNLIIYVYDYLGNLMFNE